MLKVFKFFLMLAFVVTLADYTAAAQTYRILGTVSESKPQVSWSLSVEMTSDTTGVITVKATPNYDYHLYAMEVPEG